MKRPGRMSNQALASVLKKPATLNYPKIWSGMPKNFRGKIKFISENCIGCKMCMRDCPSGAIIIKKVGEKLFEAEFNLGKCIYCGQCVDSCPKAALEYTADFELAALTQDGLKVVFHAKPRPEDPTKK